jgi:hypothetical protein
MPLREPGRNLMGSAAALIEAAVCSEPPPRMVGACPATQASGLGTGGLSYSTVAGSPRNPARW